MTESAGGRQIFDVLCVAQAGRLTYEALLLLASLRRNAPDFPGRVFIAEPQPGPLWPEDPRIQDAEARALMQEMGATLLPFEARHFGAAYPQGNKIEALRAMPAGRPFLFLDSDTLVLTPLEAVPFDFARPGASLRREATWPRPPLYGPDRAAIWGALYRRFGLDLEAARDHRYAPDDWRHFPYYNAGAFWGPCPRRFGALMLRWARSVRNDPPPELAAQALTPWLDQIVLPLVIHALGGGPRSLPEGWIDGAATCHYRLLPLLYAREDDAVIETLELTAAPRALRRVLKRHKPMRHFVYEGRGARARALFAGAPLPPVEEPIRKALRQAGLWMR